MKKTAYWRNVGTDDDGEKEKKRFEFPSKPFL